MIDKDYKVPFYAKTTIVFVGIFTFITILSLARSIIVPLVFAFIIAVVLQPVVEKLVKYHINRIVAIIIAIFITILLIAGMGILLYSQAIRFADSWPTLVEKLTLLFNQTITGVSGFLDINPKKIHEWFTTAKSDLLSTSSIVIGHTIMNIGVGIMVALLIPVYIFLILFYKPLLIGFTHQLFGENNKGPVSEVITETKTLIQRYLVGLIIEATIVAVLEIAALLFLGIEYAILLGVLGALLNVIPYIGGLVAVALPMMVALATKESGWYALYVLVIYYAIQLIDNNYIVPKIVASKVKINALFSIIVVLAGNALWGIPGMFLSIPLLAIVKLVFDHIDSLKPWGFLLGDTMPNILQIPPVLKKIKHKITKRI